MIIVIMLNIIKNYSILVITLTNNGYEMNLYLRLLWLLLRLPWMKKQADPLAPAKLTMRVMPNDLDPYFHVNNGRYLTLMDLGRVHLMSVTGLLKPLRKKKWAPLLGSAKIHFIRPLFLFNKFTMTTQTIYWDEKWFYLEQKIFRKEELCAVSLFKVLFIGKQGKVAPDALMDLLPHPVNKPMMPHYLKALLEAEKEKVG